MKEDFFEFWDRKSKDIGKWVLIIALIILLIVFSPLWIPMYIIYYKFKKPKKRKITKRRKK